jgi:aspartokinase
VGILVQKYGGSSVADVEKIRRVAERVAQSRAGGSRIVVVVSAMGDTTDELLALARKVTGDPHRRELDMLLTAGERISMALLGMALHARGVDAISFTGSQSGIITDGAHANARIVEVRPVRILEALDRGITFHARSTFQTGPGTLVQKSAARELRISGVALDAEVLVVRGAQRAPVLEALARHGAWPRESWDGQAIVPLENVHGLPALLDELRPIAAVDEGLAQVSVVGTGIGASKEPLERAVRALGVEPRSVLVSPLRLAFLVPREAAKECVRRLHAEFVERS